MTNAAETAAGTSTIPQLVPKLIRAHCTVIDEVARLLRGQGKLVITGFGEDPDHADPKTGKLGLRLPPKIVHVGIGDVDQAVERICQIAKLPHYNAYMPIAVFQPGLQPGGKGYERDVAACLGLVADFDDPDAARWADRLPVPPNYVLETSAGRFQAFYLFRKPESLEAVKPVAERLKAFAGCDHGTSDISHVWRIPGTLNWPNAKKVGEGRSREPQQVQVVQGFIGETISLRALSNTLPETSGDSADKKRGRTKQSRGGKGQPHRAAVEGTEEAIRAWFAMLMLPDDLQEEIRRPSAADRSKAIFRVITRLIELEHDDRTIEDIIYAHPKGIGEKYANRNDLDREIARVRNKTASKPVVQIRGGALPEIVDEAEQYLIEAEDDIFQRGSVIVRPGQP